MPDIKQELKDELVTLTGNIRTEFEKKLEGRVSDADFKAFEKKVMDRQKEIIDKLAELQKPVTKANEPGKAGNPEETKNWLAMIRGQEFDRKALVSDATGQILIPAQIESAIREGLPQFNVMRNLASVRSVGTNRSTIRKMTAPTVSWGKLEIGGSAPETTLVPSEETMYIEDLTGLVKIGVDELADTDVNLTDYVSRNFGIAMSNKMQEGFMIGKGHTTYQEPVGIFSSGAGITTVALDAANAITFQDIKDLIGAVPKQYRTGASFLMNSGTELELQKLRVEVASGYYGAYYWQPSLVAGQPDTLCGYPVYTDDSIPQHGDGSTQKIAAFGNWKIGYEIVDREGFSLTRLNELYITSGHVGFLAVARVTGYPVWPDAMRILVEP